MPIETAAAPGKRLLAAKGEFLGPLTASIVSIPVEANYGAIALAPLGPDFLALGALAAIYCVIISNLAGALLGSSPGLLGGTRPALVLGIAGLIADLSLRLRSDGLPDVPLIMAFTMLALLMTGVFQMLLGLGRIGRIAKYLPYPVLTGFVNGAAVLILLSALRPLIGIPCAPSLDGFLADLAAASPWTVAVGMFTVAVALWQPRRGRRIPPLMIALLCGVTVHMLLSQFLAAGQLGGTLGPLQPRLPDLDVLRGFARIAGDPDLRAMVPSLVPAAIGLAVLATVETLLTASVVDGITSTRHHADRELLVQGAANTLAACFGGLTSAAGLARCSNNALGGARTRYASLVYAAIGMLMLAGIGYIGRLPLSVMGGLIAAVAWMMIDDWTKRVPLQLLRRTRMTRTQRRSLLANYLVMLSVVAIAAAHNLLSAVFFGVLAAMFLFVRRHTGGIVRRELRGDIHRSLRRRSLSRIRELEREGWRISVLELEGPLFFGTADQLAREAERVAVRAEYLIVDFHRVTDIDVTGLRILQQTAERVSRSNCRLLLAAVHPLGTRGRMLRMAGIDATIGREHWFDTADAALEWAEDELLVRFDLREPRERMLDLGETQLGRGLTRSELELLGSHVDELHLDTGAALFRVGDRADGIYVLRKGCISVKTRSGHGTRRLASFAQGVLFGELGLLDGGTRSADIVADEPSTAYRLTREAFATIRAEHPELAAKLLFNVGVEMALRLRHANQELEAGFLGSSARR